MKVIVLIVLLLLTGCSGKHAAVCWTQGDGSSVHAEFGYFYDSAEVTLSGPSTFKRVPKDTTFDPCSGMPTP